MLDNTNFSAQEDVGNKVDQSEAPTQVSELDPNRQRTEGYVTHCDTKEVIITADTDPNIDFKENYWAVGQLISIWVGQNRVIGQTSKVEVPDDQWINGAENQVRVHIELIGEIFQGPKGAKFTTGISSFPQMGCPAHRIRSTDLAAIYENNAETTIEIGHLTQDTSIPAKIDFEKLLSRHFAVVGSTGVGKSTSVSLMLRKIVEARPDIRVLMLDPHNEFGSAFPNNSMVINASTLTLPFWLFGLDEIAEVIFRGQDGVELEKELLRDFIVDAKQITIDESSGNTSHLARKQTNKVRLNADTPIPYRMPDLLKLIDGRLGQLDNKAEKPLLKLLRDRIDTIVNDARFQFMFDPATCGGDKIGDIISRIFRVPQNGKPICVMEMSGLPSEVVSSVVSVLCRMAFDLAISSGGAIQTLVVCEEAHRYIPADPKAGFWPTRMAIGRIAKEGRKYGVFLGIITQRPGELDPTILSQCNSFFAMRLSNKKDQEIIAGAFNSGAQSTIAFLPSIANRECIAFGEAVYSPMRMTFETVQAKDLPGANIRENQDAVRAGKQINLNAVITKMRGIVERVELPEIDELAELKSHSGPAPQFGEQVPTPPQPHPGHNAPVPRNSMTNRAGADNGVNQPQKSQSNQQSPHARPAGFVTPAAHTSQNVPGANPVDPAKQPHSIEQRYKQVEAVISQAPPKTENAGNALFKAFRAK
ncbi:MAG: DUF87 domain-containing protein [Salaquimonas sp.]